MVYATTKNKPPCWFGFPRSPFPTGSAKLQTLPDFHQDLKNVTFGGYRELEPVFSKKKIGDSIQKKCITKKKQREAPSLLQSIPHPSMLQETISDACDSLRQLRAAIMNPAQANVFHRTCKHPFSFAGHWLEENTLVKFKPSPRSLLLAQHINASCETLLIYISMDHSPHPHWHRNIQHGCGASIPHASSDLL